MKNFYALGIGVSAFLLSLISFYAFSLDLSQQNKPGDKADCTQNCFSSEIVAVEENENCATYTIEVTQDGSCTYALSHYTIAIPCGKVSDYSNSEDWKMEWVESDPTTGLTGLKVDDISDFGEIESPQSFTVKFSICQDFSCNNLDLNVNCFAPQVAYKAGQCVDTEEVEKLCKVSGYLESSDVLCHGASTGSIDIIIEEGKAPFSYLWSNNATTAKLDQVPAGTYSVIITDANGSQVELEGTIIQPSPFVVNPVINPPTCNDSNNGSINLLVTGGTGETNITWANQSTGSQLEHIGAGNYTAKISDANGCEIVEEFKIDPLSALAVEINTTDPTCQGLVDGMITVKATGGEMPYTYNWSDQSTANFRKDLSAGQYEFTVTDANGCSLSETIELFNAYKLSIDASLTQLTCNTKGAISLAPAGGVEPYFYHWTNGATTSLIENLNSGEYQVMVTDENGCEVEGNYSLESTSSIIISETVTQPNCDTKGAISLAFQGGSEPYSILWNNGATDNSIENLEPGIYTAEVQDQNNCQVTFSATIEDISTINVDATIVEPTCNTSSNGSISLLLSGGLENNHILWSTGATTSEITNLPAGDYNVTISEEGGCEITKSYTLTPISILSLNSEITAASCSEPTGAIDVILEGAAAPITYMWSNGEKTEDLTNLSEGSYYLYVRDANGCVNSRTFSVPVDNNNLDATIQATQTSCLEDGSGAIDMQVSGGTAPFTYLWSNGAITEDLSGLIAGDYQVSITDANNCSISKEASITSKAISVYGYQINPKCPGSTDGAIYLTPYDGVAPYTFNWENGASSSQLTGLSAGYHTVTVTDATGCATTKSFLLADPLPLQSEVVVSQNECNTNSLSSAELLITGGTAPYTFSWSDGSTESMRSDLVAGSYDVSITDKNNCEINSTFEVAQPESLTCLIEVPTGQPYEFTAENLVETLILDAATYNWSIDSEDPDWTIMSDPTQSSLIYQAGSSGTTATFTLTITGTSGCVSECSITITSLSSDQASNDDGSSNPSDPKDGTSDPNDGASDPNDGTSDPNDGTSDPNDETSDPNDGTSDPNDGTSDPNDGTSDPNDETSDPNDGTSDPNDGTSDPNDGTSDPNDGTSNPNDGTSDPNDGTSDPNDGTSDPNDGTSDPNDGTSDPNDGTSDPNDGTSDPKDDEGITCEDSFDAIISELDNYNGCITYQVEILYTGQKSKGLSHVTIGTGCGTISNIVNRTGWKLEAMGYDKTTGITGFKIDDIQEFGEGNTAESFLVEFTVCSDEADCICPNPVVAFKAGQCVSIENQNIACSEEETDIVTSTSSPNPTSDFATITFTTLKDGNATVELYTLEGYFVKSLYEGPVAAGKTNQVVFDGTDYSSNIFIYKIQTANQVEQGKIILSK